LRDRREIFPYGLAPLAAPALGRRSPSILSCREKLAPALRKNWPLHDLALVGRGELQANLAALRTPWIRLVVGVRLFYFVRFADFLISNCPRDGAARYPNTNG
jgi:hypothetical protein